MFVPFGNDFIASARHQPPYFGNFVRPKSTVECNCQIIHPEFAFTSGPKNMDVDPLPQIVAVETHAITVLTKYRWHAKGMDSPIRGAMGSPIRTGVKSGKKSLFPLAVCFFETERHGGRGRPRDHGPRDHGTTGPWDYGPEVGGQRSGTGAADAPVGTWNAQFSSLNHPPRPSSYRQPSFDYSSGCSRSRIGKLRAPCITRSMIRTSSVAL